MDVSTGILLEREMVKHSIHFSFFINLIYKTMKKNIKIGINKELELPEVYQLKKIISEYKILVGKLQSEISELEHKNQKAIEKGKEFEKKYIDLQSLSKEELKTIKKEVKSEEMYKIIKFQNKQLMLKNRKLKRDNMELITKYYKHGNN